MTNPRSDRLLTPGEVGEIFQVGATTILRWAQSGRITSVLTPGGTRRYPADAVMDLARECGMTTEETTVDRYRELPYDPDDPDNAPLTPEEQRLQEIQDRGMRERQADQERAGHRFDITGDDWGT